ncbi:PD-(D/E)XK nuclease family protein [Geobacter sulfurreducens subsp. ethanolicus]|uniref:PD-(D/E)XK nuclease family protein n=1 Tax=Geobacter sulfurreducens TaxID=35554 RepID=UPI002574599E|nr:PD-(D/E)XK nuclease family protein [Geobacter sulfurreducens]BEH08880.1 PD-(D/E)XK nuclease family protein [Geobacter sulfurreducens subsp. ethanolicus]
MTNKEIEEFIVEAFEDNFERLKQESGHAITPDVKEAALQQVLMYWDKMRDVAEKVTETEVKLTLPEQVTPEGRKYSIHGVVDIVQEDEQTLMYDIKTHDADFVRENVDLYEKQLNVYAHIWQKLRGHKLDGTAVIATAPTHDLKNALRSGNPDLIQKAMQEWDPLIDIPIDEKSLDKTITDFGSVIDKIETRQFCPPPLEKLNSPVSATKKVLFGTDVCRNCDARFSCTSFRMYAQANYQKPESAMHYYLNEFGSDQEKSEWLDANLATAELIPTE